jgi:hypothetical protein
MLVILSCRFLVGVCLLFWRYSRCLHFSSLCVVLQYHFLQEHDKWQQVDIAILDFSKAFDTVPHDKLLHKLEQYGIKGNIHSWLTNFLALEKSKMAMSTCCHLSCSCRKSLIVVISWVSQEYPDLKPWFIFVSILFFSRCFRRCLQIM